MFIVDAFVRVHGAARRCSGAVRRSGPRCKLVTQYTLTYAAHTSLPLVHQAVCIPSFCVHSLLIFASEGDFSNNFCLYVLRGQVLSFCVSQRTFYVYSNSGKYTLRILLVESLVYILNGQLNLILPVVLINTSTASQLPARNIYLKTKFNLVEKPRKRGFESGLYYEIRLTYMIPDEFGTNKIPLFPELSGSEGLVVKTSI